MEADFEEGKMHLASPWWLPLHSLQMRRGGYSHSCEEWVPFDDQKVQRNLELVGSQVHKTRHSQTGSQCHSLFLRGLRLA